MSSVNIRGLMLSAVNARSKEMLLAILDGAIITDSTYDHELMTALILNRNRVAKFFDLPTRKFRRENNVRPAEAN